MLMNRYFFIINSLQMNEYLTMEDTYFTIKIQRPGKEKIKGLNLNPQQTR